MSREFCETSPLHSPPHHDRIIEWLKYKQKKKNEWCFINIVHILNNCRRTNGSRMNDDPQEDGQFKRTIFCVRVSYSFSVFRFSAAYDTHSHTYTPHMPWDTCDIERNIHKYTLRDKWKKIVHRSTKLSLLIDDSFHIDYSVSSVFTRELY